jgi:hypothetical protein
MENTLLVDEKKSITLKTRVIVFLHTPPPSHFSRYLGGLLQRSSTEVFWIAISKGQMALAAQHSTL